MNPPLVSVICLCYNHAQFVAEAIQSVLNQKYQRVQLIVVDDASTDHSTQVIKNSLSQHPAVEFISLPANLGNCRAFNLGFKSAKGEYIIDLAADDVLNPDRIAKGIDAFQAFGTKMGVHFSDAELIDASGKLLGFHSDKYPHETISQGDIYRGVLSRYFICSPTMMMRREVFASLGGYDESLVYEDFDFWVRSSREFEYRYTPEPLIKRRVLPFSMGQKQVKRGDQLTSTLKVCKKAMALNRTSYENQSLKKRLFYEMKQSVRQMAWSTAWDFLTLWRKA